MTKNVLEMLRGMKTKPLKIISPGDKIRFDREGHDGKGLHGWTDGLRASGRTGDREKLTKFEIFG